MEETEIENANFVDRTQKKKRVLEDKACEVCGDRSTGKHYGVFSCDGCSGFYKRTCRRTEPWLCKLQGQCPVDKSSRNDCKACRLKKCVEIGMNLEGVYRRFRFNEELVQSTAEEPPADNAPNDMRVDVAPSPEAQGYSSAIPEIRIVHTKSVMVKTEEEQYHHQQQQQKQQQQQQQQQQVQALENEVNQRRPSSPKYYDESQKEEYLAQRPNSLPAPANKDHYSPSHPAPYPSPLTTVSTPVSSPVRVTLVSQGSNTNTRPSVTATPLSSLRFQSPSAYPLSQQNGYTSPPRSAPNLPTQAPAINGHRLTSTALGTLRNVQRHLQPSKMSMSELHQAVEPFSFHTSESLHDAATRLLTVSLRFGRRLPCFRRLPFRDQVILLEEGWRELLLLDSVFWAFSLSSGGAPEAENCPREQEVKTVHEALLPLRTLKLDSSEYACLKAIILFRTNTHGLKAADQVEQLQDEAQLLLADYVWSRLPAQPARFGKILLSVAPLRSLAEKPIEHLFFSAVPAKDMFESILSQVISTN